MNQKQSENISSLMSLFMTIAALVYMFVMGMNVEPKDATWIMMVPPIGLLIGAMWFLIKPAKVEF